MVQLGLGVGSAGSAALRSARRVRGGPVQLVLTHRAVGGREALELVARRLEVALGVVPCVVRAGRDELAQQPRDLVVVLGHLRLPPFEREVEGEPTELRLVPGGLDALVNLAA